MEITELHKILYDILCSIDDACVKSNIKYQLNGGTLIGAVREHDIIAWDDDIDITISARDYNKFVKCMKANLPSYYRVIEPKDFGDSFYDFILRIQDTRYHWHNPTDEDEFYDNNQNYINVDVFPITEISNNKISVKLDGIRYLIMYGLAMGHRYKVNLDEYKGLHKIAVGVLSKIGKTIKMQVIYKLYEKTYLINKADKKYCVLCCDLFENIGKPLKSDWFRASELVQFRDRMLPVPTGYDEYLTLMYGDYMKPPKDRSKYIVHMNFDE